MILLVCIHLNEIFNVLVNLTVSKSAASITRVFWQVESGKLILEKAEFDLEAELTALIDVFSVQCDNKGLFISLQLAGQCTLNECTMKLQVISLSGQLVPTYLVHVV